jgi:hypothetical protein
MAAQTTVLMRYQDRWAVEDPVLDYIIARHDIEELNTLAAAAFMEGDDVIDESEVLQVQEAAERCGGVQN